MAEKIVNAIVGSLGSLIAIPFMKELIIFILSMSPVLELRGGLLAATLFDMNPVISFIICVLGNTLPIPFILWFMAKILKFMRGNKYLKGIAKWLDNKVEKNRGKIDKYGYLGVLLFVGVPLPGSGVWTGCLIASVLDLDKKKSFIASFLGVLLAATIMMIVTFGLLAKLI